MRLIQFDGPAPPNVMQCLDVPMPEPKAGEVLIRAHAIEVGMPDVLIRAGTYNFMPPVASENLIRLTRSHRRIRT